MPFHLHVERRPIVAPVTVTSQCRRALTRRKGKRHLVLGLASAVLLLGLAWSGPTIVRTAYDRLGSAVSARKIVEASKPELRAGLPDMPTGSIAGSLGPRAGAD